ncbi:inositol monophosphatase family protein [Mycetocola zhadangensis]|uniref:Histidinol-phosphatase n=1 Tax=Mycetocola zhadangensis TaxID=1164595 RepID=A0A3L7J5N6_9MICO|nr:inositol monophosphatase family protein [Mycetocola zhadangensis]RLQ85779.1 histidinol phosphatase [Mycetocola zhadangensis]GGE85722.1 histidinol-phosphatase [Mycetocola zhadangensis]
MTISPTFSLADDLSLALRLADAADAISLSRFRSANLEISTKPDATHVTDADLAVERAIREVLAAERPDDGILGEEYGTEGPTNRQWIIDPIDGTANFLRGVPNWATLISLAVDGVPVVGVASAPAFRKRWWAADGGGAWLAEDGAEPRRLHVSGVKKLEDASLSFQSITQWDEAGYLDQLVDLSRTVWRDRAYGDMWSYGLLAEGLLDVVGEFDVKEYDIAPFAVLVREAGGRFTAINGDDSIAGRSSLATNGILHEDVLRKLGH